MYDVYYNWLFEWWNIGLGKMSKIKYWPNNELATLILEWMLYTILDCFDDVICEGNSNSGYTCVTQSMPWSGSGQLCYYICCSCTWQTNANWALELTLLYTIVQNIYLDFYLFYISNPFHSSSSPTSSSLLPSTCWPTQLLVPWINTLTDAWITICITLSSACSHNDINAAISPGGRTLWSHTCGQMFSWTSWLSMKHKQSLVEAWNILWIMSRSQLLQRLWERLVDLQDVTK